ncbi:hypothetical protein X801_07225 [Opisthorchis viverrini]|uniref:Uncharacterized protein n=1 Tax=Opisthorchis viverrini TaxID=6198 RepID=A0A1S8WR89_OPIVI|nr:hypothetical protein X801_07225 [Opisthorchis viverrini]
MLLFQRIFANPGTYAVGFDVTDSEEVRLSEKNEPSEFKQKILLPLRSPRIYSSYRSVHQPASLAVHCEQESCFTGYAIGGHNL